MALHPVLLECLVCPKDRGPLLDFEDDGFLYNPRLRLRYPIRDGVAQMLADEAEEVGEEEHADLLAREQAEGIRSTGPQKATQ